MRVIITKQEFKEYREAYKAFFGEYPENKKDVELWLKDLALADIEDIGEQKEKKDAIDT